MSWANSGTRFPFGYYISLGTDFPPSNVLNHTSSRRASSYTAPVLQEGLTYYFQVTPYGWLLAFPVLPFKVWATCSPPIAQFGLLSVNFSSRRVTGVASLPPAEFPSPPYLEDFETNDGGWFAGGFLTTWVRGTPDKTTIVGAHSGAQAWVNGGLTGLYNNREQSWVQSLYFDFTNATSELYISAWINVDAETSYDGAKFQYSINDTWYDLGAFGDANWYNDYGIVGLPDLSDGQWSPKFLLTQHQVGPHNLQSGTKLPTCSQSRCLVNPKSLSDSSLEQTALWSGEGSRSMTLRSTSVRTLF